MTEASLVVRPAGMLLREGRLLTMAYRYGEQPRFNLPGGKPETGEDLPACLQREFLEELGLTIEVGPLCQVVESKASGREVLHLLFAVTSPGATPHLNPSQTRAQGVCWMSTQEVASAPLYPDIGPWLAQWMQGHAGDALYGGVIRQSWY